jgi:phenylacetate-CoA ligase
MVEAAEEAQFDLARTSLRLGFIGAEMAEETLRRKLLSRLPNGFVWIELYGLTETGGPAVAYAPNPLVPELHLNTDDFWIELLDVSADTPVPMGEVGEITITTRRVDGRTPLIRYRTRDLARITAGTAEAPTRISRILGRADDSLKVGGVLLYPSALAEIISDLMPATAEWRAWVTSNHPDNELCVEAEVSVEHCRRVERAFRERIGLGLSVVPAEPGSLARSRHKTRRTQRVLLKSSSNTERMPDDTTGIVPEEAR